MIPGPVTRQCAPEMVGGAPSRASEMGWTTEMGIALLGRGIAGTCGSIFGPRPRAHERIDRPGWTRQGRKVSAIRDPTQGDRGEKHSEENSERHSGTLRCTQTHSEIRRALREALSKAFRVFSRQDHIPEPFCSRIIWNRVLVVLHACNRRFEEMMFRVLPVGGSATYRYAIEAPVQNDH